MSDPNVTVPTVVLDHDGVTLEDIAQRLDIIGQQLNWMTENLQSLFAFVSQIGSNGGGLRGLMHLMKQGPPEITVQNPVEGA